VTAPIGFLAAGVRCGIKSEGPDVALIASDRDAAAAALFTTNLVKAAPVLVSQRHVADGRARAIVANAGNANACTGERGIRDAEMTAEHTASLLGTRPEEVLVASTGVIGHHMPMDKLLAGVSQAAAELSREGSSSAARAIMTTDTRPKEYALEFAVGADRDARVYRIGGIAKGAGMICPNLATMLCFITTDAPVGPTALHDALKDAADVSFHCLTVDGDASTNDTVFILANGAAGGPPLESAPDALEAFRAALADLCCFLAMELARDGEGATKLVIVRVEGAEDDLQARMAASAVANSNLVKTAIFGCDPNWGRVLAAAGRSGAQFDPNRTSLKFGPVTVFSRGAPTDFDRERARQILSAPEVELTLTVGTGPGRARFFTCDLTYDYVRINAEYHT